MQQALYKSSKFDPYSYNSQFGITLNNIFSKSGRFLSGHPGRMARLFLLGNDGLVLTDWIPLSIIVSALHVPDTSILYEDIFVNSTRKEVSVPIGALFQYSGTIWRFRIWRLFYITSFSEDIRLWSDEFWCFFFPFMTHGLLFVLVPIVPRDRITATICCATQLSGMNFFNFIAGLGNRVLREKFCGKSPAGFSTPDIANEMRLLSRLLVREKTRGESEGETERRITRFSIGRETWVIQGAQVRMYYEHRVKLKLRGMRDGNLIPSRKCREASTAISLPIVARARRIFQYAGFSTKE